MIPSQLDPRLSALAGFVREASVFADVGCDHGYLSIFLASRYQTCRGFACDISPSSVEKARNNLAGAGLLERVEPILTDGLAGLQQKGITDIILAGMGGELMVQILEQAPFIRSAGTRLILQPMSREAVLRRYLSEQGFCCKEEIAVRSGKFVYCVLCADYTGNSIPLSEYRAYAGLLPECGTPEAADKLLRTAVYLEGLSVGVSRSSGQSAQARGLLETASQLRSAAAAILSEASPSSPAFQSVTGGFSDDNSL